MAIESKLGSFDYLGLASKFLPWNIPGRFADLWGMVLGSKVETGKIALSYVPVTVTQRDTRTRQQTTFTMPGILNQVYEQSNPTQKAEWDKKAYPGVFDFLGSMGKYLIIGVIAIIIIIYVMGDKKNA